MKENEDCQCCKETMKNVTELDDLQSFLKLLSDKNRLRIFCTLQKKERCVCEIYEQLDLAQNLTSHHLRLLEKADIVSCKKVGVKVFYKLNTKKLEKNIKLLSKFFKF